MLPLLHLGLENGHNGNDEMQHEAVILLSLKRLRTIFRY